MPSVIELPSDFVKPPGFDNPPIMAIGDSLFNGMRSVTVDRTFAARSLPVMVAQAMGWPMSTPDYPRPVLLNLEQELQQISSASRLPRNILPILRRMRDNAASWRDFSRAGALTFDNLSIAGATVETLTTSWECAAERRDNMIDSLIATGTVRGLLGVNLGELHRMINSAFVLNPTGAPWLAQTTPMEWIRLRKPKRLLISVGSNHGLIRLSIGNGFQDAMAELEGSLENHKELAEQIKELPDEVEHVLITTLLPPSLIANFDPAPVQAEAEPGPHVSVGDYLGLMRPQPPGPGQYHAQYRKVLSGQRARINASEMREADEFVIWLNSEIRQRYIQGIENTRKVTFINPEVMRGRFDGKHDASQKLRVGMRQYSNEMLRLNLYRRGLNRLASGGFFSLDNHHLSELGYTVYANLCLERIADAEALTSVPQVPYRPEEDSLLTDLPRVWQSLIGLAFLLRIGFGKRRQRQQEVAALAVLQLKILGADDSEIPPELSARIADASLF